MSAGKRRVERVPKEWVDDVRQRVEAGRSFQDALREVLTADAECWCCSANSRGSEVSQPPRKSFTTPLIVWD
jgi:hypothetical protein